MKKRLAAGGLALSLLAILGIGTAAYFVADGRAVNEITTGTIDLTLTETINGAVIDATALEGIMPGQVVDQMADIENAGNHPFWTRARYEVTITAADGTTELPAALKDGTPVITFGAGEGWLDGGDGWYYCPDIVPVGTSVTPFREVTFAAGAGNEYQGCDISIAVDAQAVQSDNNTPDSGSVLEVKGWPETETP